MQKHHAYTQRNKAKSCIIKFKNQGCLALPAYIAVDACIVARDERTPTPRKLLRNTCPNSTCTSVVADVKDKSNAYRATYLPLPVAGLVQVIMTAPVTILE